MFAPRKTEPLTAHRDEEQLKLYTISASGHPVQPGPYLARLAVVKRERNIDWERTPAFAILHEGSSMSYLVLAWWGNDNELFTSVSVSAGDSWTEDASKYSFCLWDLAVIWHERNSYIKHLYSGTCDIEAYRKDYFLDG